MVKFSWPPGATEFRLTGLALLVMIAMGCGGERPATVHPSTTRPSVVTTSTASTPKAASALIPPVKRKKFLASLKAIDRDLTADREVALKRAVEVCYQVYGGKPDEAVRAYVRQTYSSDAVKVGSATADKIFATVKKWICSDGAVYRRWES